MTTRSRGTSLLCAAAAATLAVGMLPASAAEPVRQSVRAVEGSSGLGDSYFPLDGNGGIDVLRYKIAVGYDFAAGKLAGTTKVQITATEDLSSFNLDLLLPTKSVKLSTGAATFERERRHELVITPRTPISAGTTFTATIEYAGKPGHFAYAGESNWLADDHEVVAMNEPHMAPWWFPSNDHPQDKALMDISVLVPKGNQVIANGHQVSSKVVGKNVKVRWRADEPMATYLAFFAAGKFQTAKGVYKGLPWYVAVSKRLPDVERKRSMKLMKQTPQVVEWLAAQLGAYPFKDTGGLTTSLPVGFALENQTRPTYPSLSGGKSILVHELAHQWFGDSVSVQNWRDIWLNEGFATFMEVAYAQAHGGEKAQHWLNSWRDAISLEDPFWDRIVADPGRNDIFDWPIYQRGGMTLQALRHRIGEERFWQLLRTWVSDKAFANASSAEFEALAAQISGQDLTGFFDAWLRTPSAPEKTPANGF